MAAPQGCRMATRSSNSSPSASRIGRHCRSVTAAALSCTCPPSLRTVSGSEGENPPLLLTVRRSFWVLASDDAALAVTLPVAVLQQSLVELPRRVAGELSLEVDRAGALHVGQL